MSGVSTLPRSASRNAATFFPAKSCACAEVWAAPGLVPERRLAAPLRALEERRAVLRPAVPDPLDFRALDVDLRALDVDLRPLEVDLRALADERPELAVDLREVPPLDFRAAAVGASRPTSPGFLLSSTSAAAWWSSLSLELPVGRYRTGGEEPPRGARVRFKLENGAVLLKASSRSRRRTRRSMRRVVVMVGCALATAGALSGVARADFPWAASDPHDYTTYHLPQTGAAFPNDLGDDWKYAATPELNNPYNGVPGELGGIRGASIGDQSATADFAWRTSTGRPDVAIAVLDSGIEWNNGAAMNDLRKKVRLNKGELPRPRNTGPSLDASADCSTYANEPADYDANHDGVFNVLDYACDPRVVKNPAHGVGPTDLLDPQDIIIAFSDGTDADNNGFVDDIAGWDFLDNDNDPYDDVQYGHGTGEARDSNAEANNGDDVGTCPNCMVVPLRVGDSFVADVNRFAQAVLYGVDNGVYVIQEALGALNHSELGQQAVDYAYNHGVAVIASTADESAQHHNWPSNYAHTIVVNSVRKYDDTFTTVPHSYLQFNGCTNFSSKVVVSVPSSSCSSEATGRGAGVAGLIYSAALNANLHNPGCVRVDGSHCPLSADEVKQLIGSGTVGGTPEADDVNFASPNGEPEPSCNPPVPDCTDPNATQALNTGHRPVVSPLITSRTYPTRKGYDQFYGYGRLNAKSAVEATDAGLIPPEASIDSPDWYTPVDPRQGSLVIRGHVAAPETVDGHYTCRLYVAPGSQPDNATTADGGDFEPVSGGQCDGAARTGTFDGPLGTVDLNALKARFPATTPSGFDGREPGNHPSQGPTTNGRPNTEPYGFTVKVVVTATIGASTLLGEDRRNLYLHRDQDMLASFPFKLPSDGASSPVLADLDGDNRNELLVATSDGLVHAYRADGTELPGWPVRDDKLPLHTGEHAFTSGEIPDQAGGAILASLAVADANHDGVPEVYAADLEGKVYGWNPAGQRVFSAESDPKFSGKPLTPFVNERHPKTGRTQHGFIGSPVLADLDQNDGGKLEIIAAGMDRHVYAWNDDGTPVPGFPTLVVDKSKVASIDPTSHSVTFKPNVGATLNSGAIVDTPAVANVIGAATSPPEIVVGTNEEYAETEDGGLNYGNEPDVSLLGAAGVLSPANSRLYVIKSTGTAPGDPLTGTSAFAPGWPTKVSKVLEELLPVVGEGITGYPIVATLTCPSGGAGPKIGVVPDGGPGYIFNPDGSSCYGTGSGGKDNALQSDVGTGAQQYDHISFPALGHPAFGSLTGGQPSFLSPSLGAFRAVDLAAPEYQPGQDFSGAWNTETGNYRPGFPVPVNDFQFLTGPAAADIDGLPGDEVLEATASLDLAGINAAGTPINTKWPKFTTDWTVTVPTVGTLGALETDSATRKDVIEITRSGYVFAYKTDAPACSSASWPRFHHDNANTGDFGTDGIDPGTPFSLTLSRQPDGTRFAFKAPGDDLLCGKVDHYEVVQSDDPITPGNFASRATLPGPPPPGDPGSDQQMSLPPSTNALSRYVGVRAVDDAGHVGPPAIPERRGGAGDVRRCARRTRPWAGQARRG